MRGQTYAPGTGKRAVVHFSAGATSAIAGALALRAGFDSVELVYADTGSEHEDNRRFLHDCERVLFGGQAVTIVRSKQFSTIFEVFEARRFLASPAGAPCTTHLKKIPIRDYLGGRMLTEVQIFGFDADEPKRIARFENNNPELTTWYPLAERGVTKANALAMIQQMGIELPMMYRLGYEHSNCMGCVKAENHKYWAAIREDFPDVFEWYAKFERTIGKKDPETGKPRGAAINKRYRNKKRERLFLDELPLDIKPKRKLSIQCGYSCGEIVNELEAPVAPGLTDTEVKTMAAMLAGMKEATEC